MCSVVSHIRNLLLYTLCCTMHAKHSREYRFFYVCPFKNQTILSPGCQKGQFIMIRLLSHWDWLFLPCYLFSNCAANSYIMGYGLEYGMEYCSKDCLLKWQCQREQQIEIIAYLLGLLGPMYKCQNT